MSVFEALYKWNYSTCPLLDLVSVVPCTKLTGVKPCTKATDVEPSTKVFSGTECVPQQPGPKEDMLNNSIYIKLQKQTKLIYGVINLNMWLHFEVVIRKGHQDFWDVSSDFVWVPLAL